MNSVEKLLGLKGTKEHQWTLVESQAEAMSFLEVFIFACPQCGQIYVQRMSQQIMQSLDNPMATIRETLPKGCTG